MFSHIYIVQAATGGRITVFQTTLPSMGPGALENRDESGVKSSPKVSKIKKCSFYRNEKER